MQEGVLVSADALQKFNDFEKAYLAVREKEKRLLTLEEIRLLPYTSENDPHCSEWKLRQKNIQRFIKYLSQKKDLEVLEIGCGNGFLTNLISKLHRATGVDVNLHELKQAAQAFPNANAKWYCADVMSEEIPPGKFDVVLFSSSLQYFSEPIKFLDKCLDMINKNGEIHILDTPFYHEETKKTAKENSKKYFNSMGEIAMEKYYYHHSFDILKKFNWKFIYKPNRFLNKFLNDSPFAWIVIKGN